MNDLELLFTKNNKISKNINLINGIAIFKSPEKVFSGESVSKLLIFVNTLHKKYPTLKIPIVINLGEVEFMDKLSYTFLECICYDLIHNYKHEVQLYMTEIYDISTKGIVSSPLLLLNKTSKESIRKYPDKFRMDIYRGHLRRVISSNNKKDTNYLGRLYQEIDSFLKLFSIQDSCRDDVSKVIVELVGNVGEHAKTDCLIDLDVANNYNKSIEGKIDDYFYYAINIVTVGFSNILIGDGIKNTILKKAPEQLNSRYQKVHAAYNNHKKYFNNDYNEEDFCNLTTFQHKISGRYNSGNSGGTGLTTSIKALAKRSDNHQCYMISGKRAITFQSEQLEYNEDDCIGFNGSNDYINCIPEQQTFGESLINMPGTAYNLNFIMKGGKRNAE